MAIRALSGVIVQSDDRLGGSAKIVFAPLSLTALGVTVATLREAVAVGPPGPFLNIPAVTLGPLEMQGLENYALFPDPPDGHMLSYDTTLVDLDVTWQGSWGVVKEISFMVVGEVADSETADDPAEEECDPAVVPVLPVVDIVGVADWIADVLGFERIGTDRNRIELRLGDGRLIVLAASKGVQARPQTVSIHVDDPLRLYAELKERGLAALTELDPGLMGGRAISFEDPFGNQWICYRRPANSG